MFRGFRYRIRDLCASTAEEYHLVRPVVHHVEERLHPDGGTALQYTRFVIHMRFQKEHVQDVASTYRFV